MQSSNHIPCIHPRWSKLTVLHHTWYISIVQCKAQNAKHMHIIALTHQYLNSYPLQISTSICFQHQGERQQNSWPCFQNIPCIILQIPSFPLHSSYETVYNQPTKLHAAEFSLRSCQQFLQQSRNSPCCMKPAGLFPCSQESATVPNPPKDKPAHTLSSYYFTLHFNIILPPMPKSPMSSLYFKFTLYVFLFFTMDARSFKNLMLLKLWAAAL